MVLNSGRPPAPIRRLRVEPTEHCSQPACRLSRDPAQGNHDGVLASLLPGIRELRTPLAAGYLYLSSLLLLFGSRIPAKNKLDDHLSMFYGIAGWMGKPALIAASTFIAYLVGSILEVRATTVSRFLRYVRSRGTVHRWLVRLGNLREQGSGDWPVIRRLRFDLRWNLGYRDLAVQSELPTTTVDTLAVYLRDNLGEDKTDEIVGGFTNLLQDLPQMRTRLYGASKDLYGDYDRLTSEADLKVNVGAAGLLLSCVAAAEVGVWWILLVVPMTLLVYRGIATAKQANDIVVQAIVTDVVKSPKLEAYLSHYRSHHDNTARQDQTRSPVDDAGSDSTAS